MPTSHQKKYANDVKFDCDVEFTKDPVGLNASASIVSVTNFGGVLTSSETDVQKALDKLDDHTHVPYYRIGDMFETTNATDPGETIANGGYGYGTWALFGVGRMTICLNSSDADFDTLEETGGAKTFNNYHRHSQTTATFGVTGGATQIQGCGAYTGYAGSSTQSVMNPYIIVYRWRRTA